MKNKEFEEGFKKGKLLQLMELVLAGDISEEKASEKAGMTLHEFKQKMKKLMNGAQERCAYRVNPFCPGCGEEHIYYTIDITEEEQKVVDNYYEQHKNETSLAFLLEPAPLYVVREFQCPCCKTTFRKNVGIVREFRVGYFDPNVIPMGIEPV